MCQKKTYVYSKWYQLIKYPMDTFINYIQLTVPFKRDTHLVGGVATSFSGWCSHFI